MTETTTKQGPADAREGSESRVAAPKPDTKPDTAAALAAARTALVCAENLAHRALAIADDEGYANHRMMLDALGGRALVALRYIERANVLMNNQQADISGVDTPAEGASDE